MHKAPEGPRKQMVFKSGRDYGGPIGSIQQTHGYVLSESAISSDYQPHGDSPWRFERIPSGAELRIESLVGRKQRQARPGAWF